LAKETAQTGVAGRAVVAKEIPQGAVDKRLFPKWWSTSREYSYPARPGSEAGLLLSVTVQCPSSAPWS